MMNQVANPIYGPAKLEFSERDYEDVLVFLNKTETYLNATGIPVYLRTLNAAPFLQGLAFQWDRFIVLLIQRFDRLTTHGHLLSTLCSQKHGKREAVSLFLQKKMLLNRRLGRTECEEALVSSFLELLHSTLHQGIRPANIRAY